MLQLQLPLPPRARDAPFSVSTPTSCYRAGLVEDDRRRTACSCSTHLGSLDPRPEPDEERRRRWQSARHAMISTENGGRRQTQRLGSEPVWSQKPSAATAIASRLGPRWWGDAIGEPLPRLARLRLRDSGGRRRCRRRRWVAGNCRRRSPMLCLGPTSTGTLAVGAVSTVDLPDSITPSVAMNRTADAQLLDGHSPSGARGADIFRTSCSQCCARPALGARLVLSRDHRRDLEVDVAGTRSRARACIPDRRTAEEERGTVLAPPPGRASVGRSACPSSRRRAAGRPATPQHHRRSRTAARATASRRTGAAGSFASAKTGAVSAARPEQRENGAPLAGSTAPGRPNLGECRPRQSHGRGHESLPGCGIELTDAAWSCVTAACVRRRAWAHDAHDPLDLGQLRDAHRVPTGRSGRCRRP